MKHIIVLFGKPGAGKKIRLKEFLKGKEEKYEAVIVKELLRKEVEKGTEIGKKAQIYMNAGIFVPNQIVNQIVFQAINATDKSVILEGFPRTMTQLNEMYEAKIYPTIAINFDLSDKIAIERLKNKMDCSNCSSNFIKRKDEDEKLIIVKLQIYQYETYSVLKAMKDSRVEVFTINNEQEKAGVLFETILGALY